jgi:ribosomal protein L7/L12
MDSVIFTLACVGIVVALLAVNYVMVTRQEQREGKLPPWTPDAIDWDAAGDWRIRADIGRGNKIQAIKLYRELTGVGLKEAKDVIEYVTLHPDAIEDKKKARRIELEDAPGIRDLLEEGREDEAVEVYQKFAGVDEYTARDAVAKIKQELK